MGPNFDHTRGAMLLDILCADADDPRPVPPTLVVAAHPDDEVIGLGARLPRLRTATFVHTTDGAPRDGRDAAAHGFGSGRDYAAARGRELEAALALAGLGPEQAMELDCPDQEASHRLVELTYRIADLLSVRPPRPEAVITHPYEGGHPDHDATAFAVHAACRLLQGRGQVPPILVEMTSYHAGPQGWLEPYTFLPGNASGDDPSAGPGGVVELPLSPAQLDFKRRLFECFPTQQGTLQYFLPGDVERLRLAPRYDFTKPPHEGRLYYEGFSWGVTGERFRDLARQALDALGLTGPSGRKT